MLYELIVFLPRLGFLIAGLFGKQIGARNSEWVTTGLLGVCALLSWIVFFSVALGGHEHRKSVARRFVGGRARAFRPAARSGSHPGHRSSR